MPIQNGCGSSGDDDWTENSVCWASGCIHVYTVVHNIYIDVYCVHAMCSRIVMPYRVQDI
jgi:hypothetical protein